VKTTREAIQRGWAGKAEVKSYDGIRPMPHGVADMTVDDFRQSLSAAKTACGFSADA